MTEAPQFEVVIGGYRLRNVNSLSLRLSMRELADSFELSTSDRVTVVSGVSVKISIEGQLRLVGETMTTRVTKQAGTRTTQFSGFSAAQRLVKSSIVIGDGLASRTVGGGSATTDSEGDLVIGERQGLSLRQITEAVVKPFGLVVDVAESAMAIADEEMGKVRVSQGEKAYAFLKRVAERQGCILVSGAASVDANGTAKGSVRITRMAVRKSPISIVYGQLPVLSADYEDDTRAMASEYIVTARGNGTRSPDGEVTGRSGRAVDERFARYQPLIIQAKKGGNSEASMQRQAEWEMRKRIGEGRRVSLTVKGWSPRTSPTPPSPLWTPNTLYRYVDPEEGINESLVLSSVDLSISAGSAASARLEFMPPDAYSILKKQTAHSGRSGYAADPDYLQEHSKLVTDIADNTDTVVFINDGADSELIYTPEDPDA